MSTAPLAATVTEYVPRSILRYSRMPLRTLSYAQEYLIGNLVPHSVIE